MPSFKTCCSGTTVEAEGEIKLMSGQGAAAKGGPVAVELRGERYDGRLFTPLAVGRSVARHRIWMAPLTRMRARADGRPGEFALKYYTQRSTAALIVTEGTAVSKGCCGYGFVPGIYTAEQAKGWKEITDAVHKRQSLMSMQLWHTGRINHPDIYGAQPIGPSATEEDPEVRCSLFNEEGNIERTVCPAPRAMTIEDIRIAVRDFAEAARMAVEVAGMDFVEVHGAHGYLLHQFYCENSNLRTDMYGGCLENRCRLTLEILDACIDAVGAHRVGIRISPIDPFQGCSNGSNREAEEKNALYLISEIAKRNPVYLSLSENFMPSEPWSECFRRKIREIFPGVILVCGSYDNEKVKQVFDAGVADAVLFGRKYISNPDLAKRFEIGADLNSAYFGGFYGGKGEIGYTDYPFLS